MRDRRFASIDLDRAPFTVAWEITRACAYACVHCRADAQHRRDPRELSTREGFRLIDQLVGFGSRPILVITGGDPLMRADVFELAAYANEAGLRVALTPTATALSTRDRMHAAYQAGVRRVAFSIDAPDAAVHDRFRGFRGSFRRTLAGIENARAERLPLQINTTLCTLNVHLLERFPPLLEAWGVVLWAVFFLVPVGRGADLEMISAEAQERALEWLLDLQARVPFDVKTTAAPQYRRIVYQHCGPLAGAGYRFPDGLDRSTLEQGVNDGRGFMFISHVGEVMPSGFLPLAAGNVRRQDPVEIYRCSPLFSALRDSGRLKGKCGLCRFRDVCGGSRARAYAVSGDYLASDPSCPWEPSEHGG